HDQNHGQHHCVLSNVLAFLLRPELEEKMSHIDTPSEGLHCISPGGLVDGHFDLIRRPEVSIPHSGLVVYRSRRHSAFLRWMPKAPNGWGRECEVGGRQGCSGQTRNCVPPGSDPTENCFTLTRRGIN